MNDKIKEEIWKDVLGYEGYYRISNLGNVVSLDRIIKLSNGKTETEKGTTITPYISRYGYKVIRFSKDRLRKKFFLHRVILETFIGRCPKGYITRHLDGNKLNNNLDNICWGTPKENSEDMIKHGNSCRGSKQGKSKLTLLDIIAIKNKYNRFCYSHQLLSDE